MTSCILGRRTIFSLALCGAAVFGQSQPPGGGGSTGGGSAGSTGGLGNSRTLPTTVNTPTNTQRTPFPTDMPRPIMLSGKVLLSDGGPPPDSVTMERVCGTRVIAEGYTDSKGRFSFELGRNRSMFLDASSEGAGNYEIMGPGRSASGVTSGTNGPLTSGVTERSLMGCELRASLPGFRSDTVNLSNRRSMDNPDVGVIILHRIANVEGLTISATSLDAPKDARKAYDKGREIAKKGKWEEAAKQFDKAVELYPRYALAWFERGRVYEAQNEIEAAKRAYGEALKADSKLIMPYDRLARIAMQTRDWQNGADYSAKAIKLNPIDFPHLYLFNAIFNLNLKNIDAAQKSASDLIEMDKQHRIPRAEHVLALALAQQQKWEEAATHLRAFIKLAPEGSEGVEVAKKQLADVEQNLAAMKQN